MATTMTRILYAALLSLLSTTAPRADEAQDRLFARVLAGTSCKPVPNNGMYCVYKVGDVLEIGIKDVGGIDTVVGFRKSNIESELYAVENFGCIVVVPGNAHPRNYNRQYSVYISPRTGQLYQTRQECTASLH